jgi:hypothetical protein
MTATEPTPDRTIGGLAPRRSNFDASRLIAANRTTEPSTPTSLEPRGGPRSTKKVSPPSRTTEQRDMESGDVATAGVKVKSSFYLRENTQNRARAAFRATAHLEDDETYSDFAEKAILAEVERREALYNQGNQYSGGGKRLAPGRRVH